MPVLKTFLFDVKNPTHEKAHGEERKGLFLILKENRFFYILRPWEHPFGHRRSNKMTMRVIKTAICKKIAVLNESVLFYNYLNYVAILLKH